MKELETLKIYCEAQIELMEQTISKKKYISSGRRRYMMGEISGVEKVLARINRMINM